MPTQYRFQNNKDVQTDLVGVALDGVRIHYPYVDLDDFVKVFREKTDLCNGSVSAGNSYVYHSLSPCTKDLTTYATTTPDNCKGDDKCDKTGGAFELAKAAWSTTSDHGGEVGLARDGHVIYGPYNASGELWNCDEHDICNGVFFEGGSYGYVATSTFPYFMGCYGPSSVQY